eukprot:7752029-Alexandrium_andersonii.AAC.1
MPLLDVAVRHSTALARHGRRQRRQTGVRAGARSAQAAVHRGVGRNGQHQRSSTAGLRRAAIRAAA